MPQPPADQPRTAASGGRRRGLLRPLLGLLALAWIALEVWLYWLVATHLGGLLTVLLLIAGVVAGTAAVKAVARRAVKRFRDTAEQLQQGRPPAVPQGGTGDATAVLGGILLAVPTFATDVVGLACLFPPTRALLRRGFAGLMAGRLVARTPFGRAMADARSMGEQFRIHEPGGTVVPGEVVEDEPDAGAAKPGAPKPDADAPPRIIEGTVLPPEDDTRR